MFQSDSVKNETICQNCFQKVWFETQHVFNYFGLVHMRLSDFPCEISGVYESIFLQFIRVSPPSSDLFVETDV